MSGLTGHFNNVFEYLRSGYTHLINKRPINKFSKKNRIPASDAILPQIFYYFFFKSFSFLHFWYFIIETGFKILIRCFAFTRTGNNKLILMLR